MVRFSLDFYLDDRATPEDVEALSLLVSDLLKSGLMLGHGTTRGYGWFTVVQGSTVIPQTTGSKQCRKRRLISSS